MAIFGKLVPGCSPFFHQLILFTALLATEMAGKLLNEMFFLAMDGEWDHSILGCLKEPPFHRERERVMKVIVERTVDMTIIGIKRYLLLLLLENTVVLISYESYANIDLAKDFSGT